MQKYIGRTLDELAQVTGFNYKGWAVFLLANQEDTVGQRIDEDFTLRSLLQRHPELDPACLVEFAHDFYGQIVLRVIMPPQVADQERS